MPERDSLATLSITAMEKRYIVGSFRLFDGRSGD
jgi:hypothetical protein